MENSTATRRLFEMVGLHYRLPVWVRERKVWNDGCVRVSMPEMPWLAKQRDLVVETLHRLCVRKEGSEWLLSKENFSQWFVESNQLGPEDVVVWNWVEKDIPEETDFLREYCQSRDAVFRDSNFMAIVMGSIQKFALWWVLTKNRPLDLGFVKLECVPARRNWLAILAARHEQAKRFTSFDGESLIKKVIRNSTLTAWDSEHEVIRWDIVATPTKAFHKAARLIELQRKRNRATVKYLMGVRKLLLEHYPRIHEILTAYLEETSYKNIRLPFRRFGRAQTGKDARPRQVDPPGFELNHGVSGILEKGESKIVAGENADLLSVPHIQSLCEDVWHSGPKVADHNNPPTNGAIGLPLLDATEGETAGELLALRSSSRDDAEASLGAGIEQLSATVDRNGEEK